MGMHITDGEGSNRAAGVREDKRLKVGASVHDESVIAAGNGDCFFIDTGLISLTAVQHNALLYMKNLANRSLHIRDFTFQSDFTRADLLFYTPPFSGTLIDNAVDARLTNTNFTSGKTPNVLAYQGVEDDTVNSGDYLVIRMGNGPDQIRDMDVVILGQGDEIALGIFAREACVVQISMNAYFMDM